MPYEKLKNAPYTLANLKANSGAVWYSEITQRRVRPTGYTRQTTIDKAGQTYEVTATYTEESETIYKGMYPQTRKTISGTIVDTKKTYSLMYGTFDVITSYNKGKKYEKIGSDYYLYEPVESELFPACEVGQTWTVNTIDMSIFHENKNNGNIYANSYIKQYLEQVVKAKLQATSVSLPKLKEIKPKTEGTDPKPKETTTDVLTENEAKKYSASDAQKQALKYKKITDYTIAVMSQYKTIRGISISICEQMLGSQVTWLGTQYSSMSFISYDIYPEGAISGDEVYYVHGLRPSITI